jgi:hypothetical protein
VVGPFNPFSLSFLSQMVWDECQSIQDSRGIVGTFKSHGAWRAFEALLATGLAFYVDQAAEAKVCASRFFKVCA